MLLALRSPGVLPGEGEAPVPIEPALPALPGVPAVWMKRQRAP